MEGTPIQELSALCVDVKTHVIEDVFHKHANFCAKDRFARERIHGLNKFFLNKHSVGTESKLVDLFLVWLKTKNVKAIYANNPTKEAAVLGLPVINFPLSNWEERQHGFLHKWVNKMKTKSHPICDDIFCPAEAHSSFVRPIEHKNPAISLAKLNHGFHCSLYDCIELFLTFHHS